MMQWDYLVVEIGSTLTKVNGFYDTDTDNPKDAVKGFALTTIDDVRQGLEKAQNDFIVKNKLNSLNYKQILINSSAAGGLKMAVVGLTMEMTAKAGKEAALGAGAVMQYLAAGKLTGRDLRKIKELDFNLILLCGGVDYGEDEVIIQNAEKLAELNLSMPLIYAGNIKIREDIEDIFKGTNYVFYATENVFPRIDELNIIPTKKIIQRVFTEHIIKAKGMEALSELSKHPVLPTPGAVMNTVELLADNGYDDIMVVDVGGATTDVYSVTDGSEKYQSIALSPEPRSKRTVDGDLGVFINAENIFLNLEKQEPGIAMDNVKPIPSENNEIRTTNYLCAEAARTAAQRHAGIFKNSFEPTAHKLYSNGKDLTAIKWIVGTGGVLTSLGHGAEILETIKANNSDRFLLPSLQAKVAIDNDYIFSSLGMLAMFNKPAAVKIAEKSMFST